jgi:hypothetical protein
MEKLQLPLRGITTTASHEAGDMYNLVNLRPKNGVLQAVSPRKVVYNLENYYDTIFIHRLPSGESIMVGTSGQSVFSHIDTTPVLISSNLPGKAYSIHQIGNTLSLLTESDVYYILYKSGGYISLGVLPDLPVIKLETEAFTDVTGLYPAGTTRSNIADRTKSLVSTLIVENDQAIYDFFFVRYAFKMFDGRLIKHSSPIFVAPAQAFQDLKLGFIGVDAGTDNIRDDASVLLKRYKVRLTVNTSSLSDWEDIIKSVDVFASPGSGLSQIENTTIQDKATIFSTANNQYKLIEYTNDKVNANIREESKFYRILSLNHASHNILFPANSEQREVFKNLPFQEAMVDDPALSHHKIGAKGGYVYNSRLHIWNTKTTMFKGFPLSSFLFKGDYAGNTANEGSDIHAYATKVYFSDLSIDPAIMIEEMPVVQTQLPVNLSAYYSYPDNQAVRVEFYAKLYDSQTEEYTWEMFHAVDLKQHDILNISYSFSLLTPALYGDAVEDIEEQESVVLADNVLRLSDTNNPFRLSRTYQFNSKILNVASNTIKAGDYGQFPLYVLTDRIYALQIGSGDVAYSNVLLTSNEQPISDKILSTPYGVVYITKRGLKIIGAPDLITRKNEESRRDLLLLSIGQPGDPFHSVMGNDLSKVLKEKDLVLAYNHQEDEIIICGSKTFALSAGELYRSTEKFAGIIDNAYPDLLTFTSEKGEEIGIGSKIYGGTLAYIFEEQDPGYEEGKVKGIVVTDPILNMTYAEAIEDIDEGFHLPGVLYASFIKAGGTDIIKNLRIWVAETDPPLYYVYDESYNDIAEVNESFAGEVVYIKIVDITEVLGNTIIKNYSQSQGKADISLTTRPINFGTHLYKRLERAVFRCTLNGVENLMAMLHASNDARAFQALKGIKYTNPTEKQNNYKDVDLGMAANKYKYYSLSLAATCEEHSFIEIIEAEVTQEYDNDKIR